MSLDLIRAVNDHFAPFYPYIARQVLDAWGGDDAELVDLGPYALNAFAILAERPAFRVTIGDDDPEVNAYLEAEARARGLTDRVVVRQLDKCDLDLPDASIDLLLFRGGLFFWGNQPQILREAWRVIRPRGVAFVGGGFGADAPDALIEANLARARELNIALQKERLSTRQLQGFLTEAGIADHASIDHRHGLWAVLRKPA